MNIIGQNNELILPEGYNLEWCYIKSTRDLNIILDDMSSSFPPGDYYFEKLSYSTFTISSDRNFYYICSLSDIPLYANSHLLYIIAGFIILLTGIIFIDFIRRAIR